MMSYRVYKIVTSLVIVLTTLPALLNSETVKCSRQLVSTESATQVLKTYKPSTTKPQEMECIVEAISILSAQPSPNDIDALLPFLIFKAPLTELEKKGIYLHPPSPYLDYPAAIAIARERPAPRSVLLSVIARSGSTLERHNAANALLLSYEYSGVREESAADGIALIRSAALKKRGPEAQRLNEAAEYGLAQSLCKRLNGKCEEAFKKGR
jgi:hypothetical protein